MIVDLNGAARPRVGRFEVVRLWWDRLRAWDADHQIWTDAVLALGFLTACLALPERFGGSRWVNIVVQAALVVPLVWRRRAPTLVFAVVAAIAFVQWTFAVPLPADLALLVVLFTLAVHATPNRAFVGAGVLEVGVVLASVTWTMSDNVGKSLLYLTGLVAASLFIGFTLRTWREHVDGLVEHARWLEQDRDRQAQIASAAERARIARELHDVVAHNVSIIVTLADGSVAIAEADPARARDAMADVSTAGRQALADMRQLLGVLRNGTEAADRHPQPELSALPQLIRGVRGTGLPVDFTQGGAPFPVTPGASLTVYRIVQESLTNVVKHAKAPSRVDVNLVFDAPYVEVLVRDDGDPVIEAGRGHGVEGMCERASMCGGVLRAGPVPEGGWEVAARLRASG